MKPSIVFFGENLPKRFFSLKQKDFKHCDLLLILGTSLVVHPFAGLLNLVGPKCPRVLINREIAGDIHEDLWNAGHRRGLWFGEGNERDVLHLGDCDDAVHNIAELMGFQDELERLSMANDLTVVEEPTKAEELAKTDEPAKVEEPARRMN